ncbi:hypothetical protein BKA56DRAFT_614461 [Ilyonectria sp. MPI-CAGE-AT-0026]|nr:hypothetical protein BKA56DRAFT_614461 [Ilyonectria sp. MPI-CAGE-AT-0026]
MNLIHVALQPDCFSLLLFLFTVERAARLSISNAQRGRVWTARAIFTSATGNCGCVDDDLCWYLYAVPSITASLVHQRETSKPRGALSESSPSVANRDVSPAYAEGYDSAQHSLSPTIAASCSPSATPDLFQGILQSSPSLSPASTPLSDSQSATSPGSQSRYACNLCQAHFDRIGPFARPYLFQSHVKQGECQGNGSYTCMCGHVVQNYSDALVLVSTHFNKCDEPQPIGRPSKKRMATGEPEASS